MRRRGVLRAAAAVALGGGLAAEALSRTVSAEARWWSGLAAILAAAPSAGGPVRQSAVIGAWVADWAMAHGGRRRVLDGLVVVVDVPAFMYGRSGTTWGDCFVGPTETFAGLAASNSPYGLDALLAHERFHRDAQWRRHGAAFAGLYLAEEAVARADGRLNGFEVAADRLGGRTGYLTDHDVVGGGESTESRPVASVTGPSYLASTRSYQAR